MAFPFVQNGATNLVATGVNSPTITGVTAGNTLIAVWGVDAVNVAAAAPTDSAGQTWTIVKTFSNASASGAMAVLFNANAGTHTLSWVTEAQPTQSAICEWDKSVKAIGGTAVTNSTTAATLTSASYTPGSSSEVVIAFLWEAGFQANDALHCNTAGFQNIGSLSDSTPHACWMINQNGNTQNGVEANAQVVSSNAALTCGWSWVSSTFTFSIVAGFTFSTGSASVAANVISGRPGLRLGTPFSKLRSRQVNDLPASNNLAATFIGAAPSAASFALSAGIALTGASPSSSVFPGNPGAQFTGSSPSSAQWAGASGLGFTGASPSSAQFGGASGLGASGASPSSAQFPLSAGIGITGASPSSAAFDMSGVPIFFNGSAPSSALFPVSAGFGITGAAPSSVVFPPSAQVSFNGSSPSSAQFPPQASLGLVGASPASAFFDLEILPAGSLTINGSAPSAAIIDFSASTFTQPQVGGHGNIEIAEELWRQRQERVVREWRLRQFRRKNASVAVERQDLTEQLVASHLANRQKWDAVEDVKKAIVFAQEERQRLELERQRDLAVKEARETQRKEREVAAKLAQLEAEAKERQKQQEILEEEQRQARKREEEEAAMAMWFLMK